jgi:hypothetical protein
MAFKATLHIKGHPDYEKGIAISYFTFTYSQGFNQTGQPTGKVTGGIINISIPNLNDADIFAWMLSNIATKDGEIVITSPTTGSQSFQIVDFEGAALVNYNQTFSENAEVMANLTLSCKEIGVSGETLKNIWSFGTRFGK